MGKNKNHLEDKMTVPYHQITLADNIEKGLAYEPKGKSDTLIENPKFWFNDLREDELLDLFIEENQRKTIVCYYVCALGFGLVGKCGSPDNAKAALKKYRGGTKIGMMRILDIPEKLIDKIDMLHDQRNMSSREIVNILRTQPLS